MHRRRRRRRPRRPPRWARRSSPPPPPRIKVSWEQHNFRDQITKKKTKTMTRDAIDCISNFGEGIEGKLGNTISYLRIRKSPSDVVIVKGIVFRGRTNCSTLLPGLEQACHTALNRKIFSTSNKLAVHWVLSGKIYENSAILGIIADALYLICSKYIKENFKYVILRFLTP